MIYLQALLIFIFSVSNDMFSIKWHEYREKRMPFRGAVVSVILGAIAWMSLIWVINDSVWLMLPDLLGTYVGSYYGIKYHHAPLPIAVALGMHSNPKP